MDPSQPPEKTLGPRLNLPDNFGSLLQNPYPTPHSFSPSASASALSQNYQSNVSSSVPGSAPGTVAPKVAIPRLPPTDVSHGRRRSARACEPCRQRKIKCDGLRPSCSQCIYHHQQCAYEDVKRVRDQKRLGSLAKRVEAYESLLRDLEGEVDLETARKIRRIMKNPGKPLPKNDDGSDSDSSMGSLEAIDQVDEDLNRSEGTRAAGFFGKNSEIQWMRKLDVGTSMQNPDSAASFYFGSNQDAPFAQQPQLGRVNSTSMMDYHLDNLDIPLIEPCNPLAVPSRKLADRYIHAFLTYVHPTFGAIRLTTFISQYQMFFENASSPPVKWLAILNMIFAIGCRYTRLVDGPDSSDDDLIFLTRARHLGLHSKVLFEHTDLQQIQLELLVAIYLLCLGQVNRASKFSNMALRSALSLGINLRLTDNRTQDAAKEARGRLWWSIYSIEHLITSMTGRASCVGEGVCSVPPPLPCEEDNFSQPGVQHLFQDPNLRDSQLTSTLFESSTQFNSQAWISTCAPCPSLFFNFLVDLNLITHALMNKVYSIEGLRKGPSQIEYHVSKFGTRMDRWLDKIPPFYQFTSPEAGPWHLNHSKLHDLSATFVRESVCLAMSYYSARIALCRPCLTHIHTQSSQPRSPETSGTPRAQFRADTATQCLQASSAMISILPETPNMSWLARTAPWWGVLHFLMQATTALLLCLSYCSYTRTKNSRSPDPTPGSPALLANYPPLQETDLSTAIASAKKAMHWLHVTASVDPAARRAFMLCEGIVKRIAPGLDIDLRDWPDGNGFAEAIRASRSSSGNGNDYGNGNGNGKGYGYEGNGSGIGRESGMEAFEELIDFEGGVF
ncbi:unnamed protein product [Penicillium salamii]|uniref:Zn(2)-C6 fungal-type domain-containing protein n=1 Tax=Penicillium salamii TaxID=1612424 RepID=A0A9W4NG55_9EURO|nr:unnamed protein product [Penicillium salamii]CAG8183719.1 unnamed protein product [Penicillium salamii]CAG8366661.1 unnamed protein product [Penicillium salamii]CAG8374856.1 unnamed protein product [Penicillium salamii]CAG8376154.1 unnamed protein product [Penicillium salamii]